MSSTANLSDAQYEALKQFKRNIADILGPSHTDAMLIKWLRARNYNLQKTEELFRGDYAARIVNEVESMVKNYKFSEVVQTYQYDSFLGFAKDGSLVRYIAVGKGDHMGFIMSKSGFDIIRYCTVVMERDIILQRKENEKTGRDVNEMSYIFDFDGFSLQEVLYKSAIEVGLDLMTLVQEHYPECWRNIFCVNVPVYFDKVFNIFKPILKLNVLQKMQMVSRASTGNLLRKYIDEDVLPAFLGGKRVDSKGDPMCSEFLKFGGKIDEKYYLRNRPQLLSTDPGVTNVWVAARSVYNHILVIRKADSTIRIEFRTENGSITLKLLYRPFGNDLENLDLPACDEYLDDSDPKYRVKYISPSLRIQTHLSPVDDHCKAPWPGIYILVCDNTYSWFTSRRILIRTKVIPPK